MKSDRIKNWPKEERPREKLLAEGAEKQADANLLAVTTDGKDLARWAM